MWTMGSNLPEFDAWWDYDQPAETEGKFRALLERARTSANTSYYVQLLTQLSRAQGLQRKFDEAHRTLDQAQALITGHLLEGPAHIRYLLERGRVFNSSRQPEQARPLFLEAWERARSAGEDSYAVDAAHMMAIVEPPEAQMRWNMKALAAAEASADPRARKWLGSLYNNIGWTHHDAGRYDEALAMFEKALGFREDLQQERETRIARWCVARCRRSLGRVESALAMQTALRLEYERAGGGDGYVFEEIGECLLLLNRKDEARPFFAQAYELLSKESWLAESEPARLERLHSLGNGE